MPVEIRFRGMVTDLECDEAIMELHKAKMYVRDVANEKIMRQKEAIETKKKVAESIKRFERAMSKETSPCAKCGKDAGGYLLCLECEKGYKVKKAEKSNSNNPTSND